MDEHENLKEILEFFMGFEWDFMLVFGDLSHKHINIQYT
jgi:hypothetical protein